MLFEGAFDLKWTNAIARADNHIVGPPDKPEVAIFIFVGAVSGNVPVTTHTGLGRFRVMPVLFEHPDWAVGFDTDSNITFFVGWEGVAIVIDHLDIKSRRRFAHRARLDLNRWEIAAK